MYPNTTCINLLRKGIQIAEVYVAAADKLAHFSPTPKESWTYCP